MTKRPEHERPRGSPSEMVTRDLRETLVASLSGAEHPKLPSRRANAGGPKPAAESVWHLGFADARSTAIATRLRLPLKAATSPEPRAPRLTPASHHQVDDGSRPIDTRPLADRHRFDEILA